MLGFFFKSSQSPETNPDGEGVLEMNCTEPAQALLADQPRRERQRIAVVEEATPEGQLEVNIRQGPRHPWRKIDEGTFNLRLPALEGVSFPKNVLLEVGSTDEPIVIEVE